MYIIENNPYRTLGLLAGASVREISRQTNRLQKIIDAEHEPPTDDYSFPALGNIARTRRSIEDATSKLNLDSDKVNAALFWFWNGNSISDEVAFDSLKEGDLKKAFQIWDKLIVDTQEDGKRYWRPVSEKNASAFHNCFVLEMLRNNGNKHTGIIANLYFLESELSQKFISTIADNTYKSNSKELQLAFLNEVLQETEKGNAGITLNNFISIFKSIDFTAKEDFLRTISQRLTCNISIHIESTKKRRTTNKINALKAGEELHKQTKNDLDQLKSTVGLQGFAYSNTADKVANEILQCSIDFFNYSQDTNAANDYHNSAMKLAKQAESIAVGSLTKERIKENINTLEEMQFKAIQILNIVKQAYEQLAIENVHLRLFGQYKTINESAIVDLIRKRIHKNDVDLIKSSNNQTKINEYKNLVNYVMGKLGYSYKSSIKYLDYWSSAVTFTITGAYKSIASPSNNSNQKNWFEENVGCIIMLVIGLVIFLISILS